MTSTSESGHGKNVTNFEFLISSVTELGTTYNPSRDSIKLIALQALLSVTKESISLLNTATSAYTLAVDAREEAFKPLAKFITRVNNSLKASETTEQVDESAKSIVRKLRGKRASSKFTEEEIKALEAEGKEVNQISVSQMSYNSQLDNLEKFISLLTTVPQYKPNEVELKIESLNTLYNDLKALNIAVQTTYIKMDNARNKRNEILYNPLTGLVDIASDTKKYIKSIFVSNSPQFKQISKLTFVVRK